MAVTLDVAGLSSAIRLGDSTEEVAEATRLLAFTTEAISRHLGDAYAAAPEVIVNEAAIRLAGYLFDQPNAGRGLSFANAGRNSGAWTMLLLYRVHRAGSTGEAVAAAQAAMGTPGNPVTGVAIAGGNLVVTFADGTTRDETLPAAGTTGDGTDQPARDAAAQAETRADDAASAAANAQSDIDAHEATPHGTDQTARDAAAAAQSAADAAQSTATANAGKLMPPSPAEAASGTAATIRGWSAKLIRTAARAILPRRDEVVDVENGRLPGPPVVMRLGWSQTRTFTELDFDRPFPPIGGSVAGMSDGLAAPPFPPGLASDLSLFLGVWLGGDHPDIAELPSGFAVADKSALTVDGTAGVYFASTARLLASVAGDVYAVFLAGARILTETDLDALMAATARVELYRDTTTYRHASASTIFRQIALSRAPARGRGLELVITNAGRNLTGPLYVGTTDDWLDLSTLAANQLDGLVSGGAESTQNTIPVKTISFGESTTDGFGHGIVYLGRVSSTRMAIAFAQNRGVGEQFRMVVREIP